MIRKFLAPVQVSDLSARSAAFCLLDERGYDRLGVFLATFANIT